MKFSIIIPVYNVSNYLGKCVDSILSQDYNNFELILVDDGSSDDSGNICDSYLSDDRVSVIHKKNGGASDARNFGLKQAKGDYVMFIDGDDFLYSNDCISKINNILIKKIMILFNIRW